MFLSLGTHPEGDETGVITNLSAGGALVGSGKVGPSGAYFEYIVPLDGRTSTCKSPVFAPRDVTCQNY